MMLSTATTIDGVRLMCLMPAYSMSMLRAEIGLASAQLGAARLTGVPSRLRTIGKWL